MELSPMKPIEITATMEITDPIAFLKACGEMTNDNTNDHAEVGALLAKCEAVDLRKDHSRGDWIAIVYTNRQWVDAAGDTQLAAIRAAVEAAEKGVRE